uniref:Histone-lysine N-methyltransferase n=1 Tax=Skeletonema marinoi TaxID=267567 RepID=A0A7S2M487_9STRA
MITMGQNESIHLASPTSTAAFVSPLSNRMMISSQQHGQLQLQAVAMPEAVSSPITIVEKPIPHITNGAENSDPNPVRNRKPLEVRQTDGGMVLISIIPNGFAVVDNEKFAGKKIVATECHLQGSVMYTGYAAMLDLSSIGQVFEVKIYSEDRELLSKHYNDDTHSVDDHAPGSKSGTESKRQVYGWDGFMNHSCDANAYFPLLYRTPTEMCYQAIALRDINVGDEVTCDYALFDYQCNGHEIEVCACGSTKCRGKILGFQGLPLQTKVELLCMVEEEIKDKFLQEENVVVYQSYLPQGIGLVTSSEDGSHLVATRRFDIGQPLFINSAQLIPMEDLTSKKFVLDVDGKYILLDKEHHFIYRDEYAEMLGFDSFMDHSCSPSTEQEYITKNEYVVRAKKVILPGDKITCDYGSLENSVAKQKNLGTSSFVCKCGESNCRGALVC